MLSHVALACSILCVQVVAQTEWSPLGPTARGPQGAIHDDAARGVQWAYAPDRLGGVAVTWRDDGDGWEVFRTPQSPTFRMTARTAYDSVRGRLVLYGGLGATSLLDDTWEFDGATWTQVATTGPGGSAPVVFGRGEMAFDPVRAVTVLRVDAFHTAEWDGVSWTVIAHASFDVFETNLAYDASIGEVVCFGGFRVGPGPGGFPSTTFFDSLRGWNGVRWAILPTSGTRPSGRRSAAVVYDPSAQALHVFGGIRIFGAEPHHVLQGGVWSLVGSGPSVASFATPSGAYDSARDQITASTPNGKQVFDGVSWSERPSGAPADRANAAVAWDPERDRTIVFGGRRNIAALGDHVEWDGSDWQEITGVLPPARQGHSLTFHDASRTTLLFGGRNAGLFNDTWAWDGAAWTPQISATTPPARRLHAAADDAGRGVLVVFGGISNSSGGGVEAEDNQTWEWDGTDWTQRFPATSPSARSSCTAAYDPIHGRVILHGGRSPAGEWLNDTWQWDGADWQPVAIQGAAPLALVSPAVAWDVARERLVLTGSNGDTTSSGVLLPFSGVTWELVGGDTWVERDVGPAPSLSAVAYDAMSAQVVGIGGPISDVSSSPIEHGLWRYGPVAPAVTRVLGSGCLTGAGTELATSASLAWTGTVLSVEVGGFDAASATPLLSIGFSDVIWEGLALPVDLALIGAAGCSIHTSVDLLEPLGLAPQPGTAIRTLPIPNDPANLGVEIFWQGLALDATANPLGLVTANSVGTTIGSL